jgi:hypothetical protein
MYVLVNKQSSNELGVFETQREILQDRKKVWHADKGIWVSQKAPGGFDTVVEATTEV